jgi:cytosine/adenosine deaminase-related metal-dependent hydrolase
VFGFITDDAARALRLEDYGVIAGGWADLNVLAAPTVQHVLRLQQPPAWVLRGRVLARNEPSRELFLE